MIDQLEKEIHEGMLDLYQHQSMSRERESLVYFYFAGIHNENITLKEEIEKLNNIINELEKELEDMATLKTDKYGNTRKITHIDINWLLTKIKELKGSDKE